MESVLEGTGGSVMDIVLLLTGVLLSPRDPPPVLREFMELVPKEPPEPNELAAPREPVPKEPALSELVPRAPVLNELGPGVT